MERGEKRKEKTESGFTTEGTEGHGGRRGREKSEKRESGKAKMEDGKRERGKQKAGEGESGKAKSESEEERVIEVKKSVGVVAGGTRASRGWVGKKNTGLEAGAIWSLRCFLSLPACLPASLPLLVLRVASGEDAGDVVEDVRGAGFVVAEVFDEALLDDVDLLLGVVVDDAGDEVLELDGVA